MKYELKSIPDRMECSVEQFNRAVELGIAADLIQQSEERHKERFAEIAQDIKQRGARIVLIAGPSSSGKTTFCHRLSLQLESIGIKPHPISLDDYYVNRDRMPLDETGTDYDYESLWALDVELFNRQLCQLLQGEEVELPRYDFTTAQSILHTGHCISLHEGEVLLIEGIHGLNPELTAQVSDDEKYRIFASALTTIILDEQTTIPPTDNRLLRRMIRDVKSRNTPAQETLRRWPSVRRGEEQWIFPHQHLADTMFNTAMLFELAVIKPQAQPALQQVAADSPQYAEAQRLLSILSRLESMPDDVVPKGSLLREFIG